MDCNCRKRHDTFFSVERSKSSRIDDTSQPPKSQRLIDFEIKTSHSEVVYTPDDRRHTLRPVRNDPIYKGCTVIEASDLESLFDTFEKLNGLLSSQGLNSCCVRKACLELCRFKSSSNKHRTLLVTIETHNELVVCEECLVDRAWNESRDGGFLPASEVTIKELLKTKGKIAKDSECADCMICLEEFHSDEDAVVWPCSHVFHEACTDKWLHVSHYCPLCRYEMPTATIQSD